jgi:predicted O-methyltransferase YrrM
VVEAKYHPVEETFNNEHQPGTPGKVATQLMTMYRMVEQRENPTVVEFGVHRGQSTGVLAHACEKTNGRLISVDIEDCSDVIASPVWKFIQQDDSNIDSILQQEPIIRSGIDLLYIDSLHAPEHVAKLLMLWFPYVKENAYITVDDVDPFPYMRGQRKDDADREIVWRGIQQVVMDFFHANHEQLYLEMHYGSTGLAVMYKLAPLQTQPNPPKHIRPRTWSVRSVARQILKPVRGR